MGEPLSHVVLIAHAHLYTHNMEVVCEEMHSYIKLINIKAIVLCTMLSIDC